MKEVSELRTILGKILVWNKARLDCLTRMLLALFVTRTVNLSELAVVMASRAEVGSRYKRLQRFFRHCRFDYNRIASFIRCAVKPRPSGRGYKARFFN